MADAQRISVNVFFATMVVATLAILGLGAYYLVGPRPYDDEAREGADRASIAGYESEAQVIDSLRADGDLDLADYQFESGRNAVTGSVMNNTAQPFVRVEVIFDVYDADSARVAVARDTTSEVEPGNTWQFSASVPPNRSGAYATLREIKGAQKPVLESQGARTPDYIDSSEARN